MADGEEFMRWKISTNTVYNTLKTDTKYSHSKDKECFRNGLIRKPYVWHAVCSKIQSSQIFIQSNHFGVMQFNLIFQIYSNNPKKHSIQTHVSQFSVIRVNIYSIQSRKYLFNPITKIFIQSNHGNIYSIQSRKYSFNQ